MTLWTIGHSNVAFTVFLKRLRAHQITLVADVRRFPKSRRHPHFSKATLAAALAKSGIDYLHVSDLGGHREPRPDSRNSRWRNDLFRGYADYMETPTFRAGIDRLLSSATDRKTIVMCAELAWLQCHRALIADYLKAEGHQVLHVTADGVEPHPYTPAAQLVDGRLSYEGTELV